MTISGGEKHYYMNYNNKTGVSVIEFLDSQGVNPNKNNSSSENEQNSIEENNVVETNVTEQ